MAARVRTHMLFDMERNAVNEYSVMSSRRAFPHKTNIPSHTQNAPFNLCGLNLRNESKPRAAKNRHASERSTRITGGFESSNYASKSFLDRKPSCRQNFSNSMQSDSERSDELHLMNYESASSSADGKKYQFDLWDDRQSPTNIDAHKPIEKPPTAIRGRMYSRKKNDDNSTGQYPLTSPEFHVGTKFGAVPKKNDGSLSTASNMSSLTSSSSSDFFMIPKHLGKRFAPIGNINLKQSCGPAVGMMEVSDPKLCIVLDMIEARDLPQLELSPDSLKPYQQRALMDQMKCLKNVMTAIRDQTSASDAMILMNIESNSLYPFLTYIVVDTQSTDSRTFSSQLDSILSNNIPQEEIHCLAGYEEVATIAKAPLDLSTLRKPTTNQTGYIISMFKVFAGEDSEKLERSWLMWTGARSIYKQIPEQLGLRRITFHKKRHSQAGGLVYVLICECFKLQEEVNVACGFVSNLRARCCGYTAIYRPIDVL